LSHPGGRPELLLPQIAQDLSVVHSFYLFLLESAFGHEVPVPIAIAHDTDVLHRFVLLLDMAVTPQMIRDGLKVEEHRASAEALLRFFAAKSQRRREDRDKADVIATALYRPLVWEDAGALAEAQIDQATLDFEADLRRIYKSLRMPEPPNEHTQLVRGFEGLRKEIGSFRHFDELIDSGVIQRVRDIKQALDASFLHPKVLSVLAAYNVFFHQKFDKLFIQAAKDVKTFAAQVQRDGSSMTGLGDGDAIEKQLTEVGEGKILNAEYSLDPEDLRHISQLKKAMDRQRFGKAAELGQPGKAGAGTSAPTSAAAPSVEGEAPSTSNRVGPSEPTAYATPRSSVSVADLEAQELQGVEMTIRSFVRAADAQSAHVVPLPHGNITLTDAEVEAFRAEYGNEKSFRANLAASLIQMAALDARLLAQLQAFEKTRHTAYNWKPHADALAHLLSTGSSIADQAMQLAAVAKERGLHDKAAALSASIEKVRPRGRAAAEALQSIGSSSE
jgi:hypothetical protein